ncbi:serine/threonine-protein phosphatase [Streptomyces actinomycinicus]|uniref:Serine/threonine-protein phosphatase n=1 Tax=Streptomyces actinomycinicus TaxID=1695166 RepID=A0A937EJ79_9ACTN|nr:PP2C family protein-serine/threonine phosphatase [Streptomyces actinomycinicus]MBL1083146.1 serine/threonine-protein phosphatase [Streptomyces actinomycinicus]
MTEIEYGRRRPLLWVHGRSIAWLPPLLLLAGIVLLDLATSEDFRIVSWIVLVPGIAAAICGVWTTAAYSVLAVVTYVAVDSAWSDAYRAGLGDFLLVALGGALATLAAAVRVRHERQILHIRDIAETTRRTVLRPLPPCWGGLEHAGVYLAADVEARVGGDFYDIQPGPQGTRLLVGDVQGKGLGAVEAAAALLGTFREAGYHERALTTVAERLETRMLRHRRHTTALGRDDGDRFATAVLIAFPADAPDVMDLVNFGHEPPLVVGPRGVRELPSGDGVPLGLADLAHGLPPVHRVPLAADETLLLVTDGVTEARDGAGDFYQLAREVARAVGADPGSTEPRSLVRRVRDGVLRYSGGRLQDDTTIFAVRRAGTVPGPETEMGPGRGPGPDTGPGPGSETETGARAGAHRGTEPGEDPERGRLRS